MLEFVLFGCMLDICPISTGMSHEIDLYTIMPWKKSCHILSDLGEKVLMLIWVMSEALLDPPTLISGGKEGLWLLGVPTNFFHNCLRLWICKILNLPYLKLFFDQNFKIKFMSYFHSILHTNTARFSLHQVHGTQCTKKDYTKYSWRTLADMCMVSEVLHVVPRCRVLL